MPSGVFSLKQVAQALAQGAWSNQKPVNVDYLVVAGGGGANRGGGGGGGLLQGNTGVSHGSSITVTVGGGGSGVAVSSDSTGNTGSNSVFGSITASGGGGGGGGAYKGGNGASGGGAGASGVAGVWFGGQNVAGQGNIGGSNGGQSADPYPSGGGGGAGTAGLSGGGSTISGGGGAGIASDISGTRTTYAGGGGGAGYTGGTAGAGGAGGGGAGVNGSNGTNGTANTGGGAGGAGVNNTGGNGGSGIVIISYPDIYQAAASTTGSPTVSTSGSGSILFNGSSQHLNYAAQSGFALGTGNFTLELFVYLNSFGSGDIVIFDARPQGTQGVYPVIYFNSSNLYWFVDSGLRITGTGALAINTWYHIAVSKVGTSTKMFVNGTQVGSTYTDTNNYLVGSDRPTIAGGGYSFGSNLMNGYISNLRIVKGTGLYSSNFTAPTAPLTAVTNTTFLLSTVSGAYLADNSGNGYAATATGTPTWNQLSPFATGLGYKNRVYTWTSSGSITF